jgi:hypothetical protein
VIGISCNALKNKLAPCLEASCNICSREQSSAVSCQHGLVVSTHPYLHNAGLWTFHDLVSSTHTKVPCIIRQFLGHWTPTQAHCTSTLCQAASHKEWNANQQTHIVPSKTALGTLQQHTLCQGTLQPTAHCTKQHSSTCQQHSLYLICQAVVVIVCQAVTRRCQHHTVPCNLAQ